MKTCAILFILCISIAARGSAQYGFNLISRNDTIQQVLPESTAAFRFTLVNAGTMRDTFSLQIPLEADSFPSDEWSSLVSIRGMLLPSGGTAYVHLMPDSADTTIQFYIYTYSVYPSWGTGKTTLFVTSKGDPAVRDSVNLRAKVAQFACGDCNGDGKVIFADVLYLKNYYYQIPPGSPIPIGYGDVNLDTRIDFADALYLKNYYYQTPPGSPPPCEPPKTAQSDETRMERRD